MIWVKHLKKLEIGRRLAWKESHPLGCARHDAQLVRSKLCSDSTWRVSADVVELVERSRVEESQSRVNAALEDYCCAFYPHIADKFGQILARLLPEIRTMSILTEQFLFEKHASGEINPDNFELLTEMLHSTRKSS